jgi:hypothetical protein
MVYNFKNHEKRRMCRLQTVTDEIGEEHCEKDNIKISKLAVKVYEIDIKKGGFRFVFYKLINSIIYSGTY